MPAAAAADIAPGPRSSIPPHVAGRPLRTGELGGAGGKLFPNGTKKAKPRDSETLFSSDAWTARCFACSDRDFLIGILGRLFNEDDDDEAEDEAEADSIPQGDDLPIDAGENSAGDDGPAIGW